MNSRHSTPIRLGVLFSILLLTPWTAHARSVIRPAGNGQMVDQVVTSKTDLWGEAALKQPDGPTYDYFQKLLPPLRYTEAAFRIYPITLSAPGAATKVRLLGDGSAVNALARQLDWTNETGTPVTFRVGERREVFGSDPKHLTGPKLAGGYLPVVQMHYRHGDVTYAEETFADVDGFSPQQGVAFVRFTLPEGTEGRVEAQWDSLGRGTAKEGVLRDPKGKILACFDKPWEFNLARGTLTAYMKQGESATLAIYTVPGDEPVDLGTRDQRLQHCTDAWNKILAAGMSIETPENVVNNAWRATTIGNYELLNGDEIRYSQGNQYQKLYIGEGGDATRTFALYGHLTDAARMMTPLFVYTRKNLEFHQAAFKLQMMTHVYRLSGDRAWIDAHRNLWEKELNVILNGRESSSGMLPREKYCGDIDTMVYSLNSNANCWRALRDMSVLLDDLGEKDRAQKIAATAGEYRKVILAALDKAIQRNVSPPFVPIALSGEETAYEDIPAQRMGGYWNIMTQYVLGSGVFPADGQIASDIIHYLQRHGGLCMGMLKTHGEERKYWLGSRKINDLYGMRYALTLLRRDEPDRALVSFYGKLAQGFTRDTFECCEGSDIVPLDEYGRIMFLPPNSAGNSNFLQQLRYLLVQDYDSKDDGRADTLRLAFATPRAWLKDGGRIAVKKAPTEFGQVSFVIESALNKGFVDADVTLPDRRPAQKTLLRLRLPDGRKIASAKAGEQDLKIAGDGETLDLSGMKGTVRIHAQVSH